MSDAVVWIVRHMKDNTLGALETVLSSKRHLFRYLDLTPEILVQTDLQQVLPDPGEVQALILLGGAFNVDQEDLYPGLKEEKLWIKQVIDAGRPVLGICLGSQLIARVLDATVSAKHQGEIGWKSIQLTPNGLIDPVLSQLGQSAKQFHWHEDSFQVPAQAAHLARTAGCSQQAFCYQDRVYGVQFHPEVSKEQIERWLQQSSDLNAVEKDQIREETALVFGPSQHASRDLFEAFCDLIPSMVLA